MSGMFPMTVTHLRQLTDISGAYCAMVLISLLRLPLELPHDAPTRSQGKTSFLDDLPEWLSRCKWNLALDLDLEGLLAYQTLQVRHTKEVYQVVQAQRHMVHMLSVPWPVCVS